MGADLSHTKAHFGLVGCDEEGLHKLRPTGEVNILAVEHKDLFCLNDGEVDGIVANTVICGDKVTIELLGCGVGKKLYHKQRDDLVRHDNRYDTEILEGTGVGGIHDLGVNAGVIVKLCTELKVKGGNEYLGILINTFLLRC